MKTVLTSIITSVITVIIALLVVHAVYGDGGCIFSHDDDHDKECTDAKKSECCDKKHADKEKDHAMCMEKFGDLREKFDAQLSDEEKATIEAVREKFEDIDHEKMCPEGKEKFNEQYKEEIASILAIADNHKEFFDGVYAKMHESHEKVKVDEHEKCPEAKTCKEATEKCKGEAKKGEPKKVAEKKCTEAKEECEKECFSTFKVHFILMDKDCDHEGHDH